MTLALTLTLTTNPLQATTDGSGAPTYFASADEVQAEMASLKESDAEALPTVTAAKEIKTSAA